MKKTLLALLLLVLAITSRADNTFFQTDMFYYDSLTVSRYTSTYMTLETAFDNAGHVDKTNDGIYFILTRSWYVIYVPEVNTKITVRCIGDKCVNEHFLVVIENLRKERTQLKYYFHY